MGRADGVSWCSVFATTPDFWKLKSRSGCRHFPQAEAVR